MALTIDGGHRGHQAY